MSDTASTGAARGPRTSPLRYAVGMFGTSIPINVIKGSMVYFYVSILGMDAAAYAAVYSVYGIIDAIDNPLFGYLSDRTRSRWGRRRPYLIVGALLLMVAMIALFWVPSAVTARTATLLVGWFAVFAILSEASDSLINANYGALLPELFPAERRRALANSLRQGFQLVAMVLSLGLTPVLARSVLGCEAADPACLDPAVGYRSLALIYGVLGAAVIIFMAVGIHEDPDAAAGDRPRFWRSIREILATRYFWTIGVVSALYLAAMAMIMGGLQFYVDHSLGGGALEATILQITVIVASVGFLALWTLVVRRKGAMWTWRVAVPVAAVSFLPLSLARTLAEAVLAGLCVGIGYSGLLATNDLMQARVLDEDARLHGVRREGIFLSAFGVLGRLNAIPTSIALASLGWFFGYHSGDDPGTQAGTAWRVYMSLYPFVLLALATLVSRFAALPIAVRDEDGAGDLPTGEVTEE
ncbi:MFS transporter [Schaalia naturae]|uniref:MFS transporter n=1 Tax=Schaalia naturae TaxID=635203 RepID=A0ABW2SQH7_9ACTO